MSTLHQDLQDAINRHRAENGSNTPDFILANYLAECLRAFDSAVNCRADWYGRRDYPGSPTGLRDLPAKATAPRPDADKPRGEACANPDNRHHMD